MNEIQKLLADSKLSIEIQQSALAIAFQVCMPIAVGMASSESARAAREPGSALGDGTFLKILMQLLTQFLPIILQLLGGLKPT